MNSEPSRVVSLAMRPRSLGEMVGQQDMVDAIRNQFASGRIPHFLIIGGPVGSGKTTLARILGLHIQLGDTKILRTLTEEDWRSYKRFHIEEINAANQTGVDYVRQLTESVRYKPLPPSKVKVLVLDEAHQLSNSAQNCLLTETEDVASHVFIIFCTSQVTKIIPGLRRRAYILQPKALDQAGTSELLEKAKSFVKYEGDVSELAKFLVAEGVVTPGLIVQAAERFFCGLSVSESINFAEMAKFDGLPLCRSLVAGDWSGCASHLRAISKGDVFALRSHALGYLKAVLLKTTGSKAIALSNAVMIITKCNPTDDTTALPSFIAAVCLACESLVPQNKGTRPVNARIGTTGIKQKVPETVPEVG
jgi:energy-coupling factor transporter ATP-binding protein EcfA2